jgi:hypothetical protein
MSSGCFGVGDLLRWIQRSASNGNANVSGVEMMTGVSCRFTCTLH